MPNIDKDKLMTAFLSAMANALSGRQMDDDGADTVDVARSDFDKSFYASFADVLESDKTKDN